MFIVVDRRTREIVPSNSGDPYRRLKNAIGAAKVAERKGKRVIVLPAGSTCVR